MLKQFLSSDLSFYMLFIFFSFSLNARVHDYETTRLKSTAGAGIGSVLMDEATILNPAPIAFYTNSAVYISQTGIDVTNQDDPTSPIVESKMRGFIISDSKGSLNGSISLLKQVENGDTRERLAAALAAPIGDKSSMGITYRKTKDKNVTKTGESINDNYSQIVVGVTHSITPSFSIGLIAIDPMQAHPDDTKGIVGFQYLYKSFISVMFDIGTDYRENLSNKLLYRTGVQFKIFSDFYLRVGLFNDKGQGEKGNGFGIGWVQPKLVIDFAVKNTNVFKDLDALKEGQDILESSFSLSYRF